MKSLLLTATCITTLLAPQAFAAATPAATFRPQVIDPKIQIGYGLAIADVDGDGRNDILLADAREIVWYRSPKWEKFVMARELTVKDNVCIAAQDIDGDGKAEVAVGAEWNPGDTVGSGAIFYLDRPQDPTQPWRPVRLPHEPTTHRMHWIHDGTHGALLAVLPLHGRGNKGGQGDGIVFLGYKKPARVDDPWPTVVLDRETHQAHNFDPTYQEKAAVAPLFVAAKEGVRELTRQADVWTSRTLTTAPAGEVRVGKTPAGKTYLTTIEPMHGNQLVVYAPSATPGAAAPERLLLDGALIEGHALAVGDVLGLGYDQVVAGWRGSPTRPGQKVGIKLFIATDPSGRSWKEHALIDDNQMACEDLKLADLNGDGRLDIIAAGRATKNVVIYWNESSR